MGRDDGMGGVVFGGGDDDVDSIGFYILQRLNKAQAIKAFLQQKSSGYPRIYHIMSEIVLFWGAKSEDCFFSLKSLSLGQKYRI